MGAVIDLETIRGAWQLRCGGEVVGEGAGGLADEEAGRPCTIGTRFQAASVSKQFVAASVLLLEQRGALALTDPVQKWWAKAPQEWSAMTVGHLLQHGAGLPHWSLPGVDVTRDPPTKDEVLELVAGLPLQSRPGERWAYSGPGFLLAATVVEAASGTPYGEFVAENVFAPLGMANTTSCVLPDPGDAAAPHHDGKRMPLVGALTALPGTADVWTTVPDLLRYAAARDEGVLLEPETWVRMSRLRQKIEDAFALEQGARGTGYGYGLLLGTIGSRPSIYHSGDNPGYQSILAWFPSEGCTCCVLSNEGTTAAGDVVTALFEEADLP
jgi:CubicO group peptidase (beta-lactamase class C family)